MKIDYQKFEHNNWDEFVHVRALMDLLSQVAQHTVDGQSIKSIDGIDWKTDGKGNATPVIKYTDQDGSQHELTGGNVPAQKIDAIKSLDKVALNFDESANSLTPEIDYTNVQGEPQKLTGEAVTLKDTKGITVQYGNSQAVANSLKVYGNTNGWGSTFRFDGINSTLTYPIALSNSNVYLGDATNFDVGLKPVSDEYLTGDGINLNGLQLTCHLPRRYNVYNLIAIGSLKPTTESRGAALINDNVISFSSLPLLSAIDTGLNNINLGNVYVLAFDENDAIALHEFATLKIVVADSGTKVSLIFAEGANLSKFNDTIIKNIQILGSLLVHTTTEPATVNN